MQTTLELMGNIKESLVILKRNVGKLEKRYKELNKKFDTLYHELEKAPKFDMYKGYLKAKELQEVLQERRLVKGEWTMAKRALDNMKGLESVVHNSYNGALQWEERGKDWLKDFQITHDDIAI